MTNRGGDGPDTPAGVRDRVARANDPSLQDLLARVDDETIAMAIRGLRDPEERWVAVPPGGKHRLFWPLPRDFFAGQPEAPQPANDQDQPDTERPVRAPLSDGASTPDRRAEADIARARSP